jgi:hypothetical protein
MTDPAIKAVAIGGAISLFYIVKKYVIHLSIRKDKQDEKVITAQLIND